MTREERRRILGGSVIEHIHREVKAALAEAPPTEDVLADLRRIFARPAGQPDRAVAAEAEAA